MESHFTPPTPERFSQAGSSGSPLVLQEETRASGTPGVHPDWTDLVRSDPPPDLILSARNATIFYVHRKRILGASANDFNGKLSSTSPDSEDNRPIIVLPYSSTVVNLLLHAVYDNDDGRSQIQGGTPSLLDLSSTIRALRDYGIRLETSISESSTLFGFLSSHCQHSALDVYALAASHAPHLHPLAMYASSFLHSLDFSEISEERATAMGSIYLRRLYTLLSERTREFKQLLLSAPKLHVPDQQCDTQSFQKAMGLAFAYLMWSAAPDVKDVVMDNAKSSVINQVSCEHCRASSERRFDDLKRAWSLVKSTI